MAYAALVSLAQQLKQIHQDPNHILHHHDQKQQFQPLYENVLELQEILEDFPKRCQTFEKRIADSANEADDMIDCYVSHRLPAKDGCCGFLACFSDILLCVATAHFPHYRYGDNDVWISCVNSKTLHQKLQKTRDEISSIVNEIANVQVSESLPNPNRSISRIRKQLSSKDSDSVIGFDKDIEEIKGRLCEESYQRHIIPIVGMGGAGKTTLARKLYQDRFIMKYFDARAWITVSQNYDLRETLLCLLGDIKGFATKDYERVNNEGLGVEVYKSLKARRYLIVIDDIWSNNFWDDVQNLFPDDQNRSRILMTTRLSDVAVYADSTSPIHNLQLLDLKRSWRLLKGKVFGQEPCPLELQEIGKTIAKNCGGLPLAIVVVAGVLSDVDQNHDSWKSIAENVNSVMSANGDQISDILSLSYGHLPHHLKPCFQYVGSFPEDYEIPVRKLIMLWVEVAEDFLKPSMSKSPEDLAYEYMEDLVKKNLIFVLRRKSNGLIKSCRVHDLIRDLCVKTAQGDKFLHLMDNYPEFSREGIISPRRLAISSGSFINHLGDIYSPSIRSALYLRCPKGLRLHQESFRLLRVLDALTKIFENFPSQVCQLLFLKYLAFSHNNIHNLKLPSAIRKLKHLQILIISPNFRWTGTTEFILFLPLDIWKMPQLRHLVFLQKTILPMPMPPSHGENLVFENLQTLWQVVNVKFTKQVLQMIPNIKKLGIFYSNKDSYPQCPNYCLENLVHLLQLETLSLKSEFVLSFPFWKNMKLPESLRKLNLTLTRIPWSKMGLIAGSLPNLEVLKLRQFACCGHEWETKEGQFRKLRMLEINETWLHTWSFEDSSNVFPSLERLCIFNSKALYVGFPECMGEIETLQLIELDIHSDTRNLVKWAKGIQEEQLSMGNEVQVRIHNKYISPVKPEW